MAMLLLLVGPWLGGAKGPNAHSHYVVDTTAAGQGPVFDGVGAISGGGGETVLLPYYPAQQRAEIQQVLAAVKVDLCRWKALFSSTIYCRSRGITHGLADRFWGHLRLCHNDLHGIVLLLCLLLPSSIFFA